MDKDYSRIYSIFNNFLVTAVKKCESDIFKIDEDPKFIDDESEEKYLLLKAKYDFLKRKVIFVTDTINKIIQEINLKGGSNFEDSNVPIVNNEGSMDQTENELFMFDIKMENFEETLEEARNCYLPALENKTAKNSQVENNAVVVDLTLTDGIIEDSNVVQQSLDSSSELRLDNPEALNFEGLNSDSNIDSEKLMGESVEENDIKSKNMDELKKLLSIMIKEHDILKIDLLNEKKKEETMKEENDKLQAKLVESDEKVDTLANKLNTQNDELKRLNFHLKRTKDIADKETEKLKDANLQIYTLVNSNDEINVSNSSDVFLVSSSNNEDIAIDYDRSDNGVNLDNYNPPKPILDANIENNVLNAPLSVPGNIQNKQESTDKDLTTINEHYDIINNIISKAKGLLFNKEEFETKSLSDNEDKASKYEELEDTAMTHNKQKDSKKHSKECRKKKAQKSKWNMIDGLPHGWKTRTVGNKNEIEEFLTPNGIVFKSRDTVLKYLISNHNTLDVIRHFKKKFPTKNLESLKNNMMRSRLEFSRVEGNDQPSEHFSYISKILNNSGSREDENRVPKQTTEIILNVTDQVNNILSLPQYSDFL